MTEREHELSKDCWCDPIVEVVPPRAADDTVPIVLVVCGHTDSPWCPRCAGGLQ